MRADCSAVTLVLALASLGAQAQVYKCVSGQDVVSYQSVPCDTGLRGEQVHLHAAPMSPEGPPPVAVPAARRSDTAHTLGDPPAPVNAIALQVPPTKSGLDTLADICLDWYRPLLRDPRGAYYRDATYRNSVLDFTVFGTNGFGGYVSKVAACEIRAGALDEGWTRTLAKRHGWGEKQ